MLASTPGHSALVLIILAWAAVRPYNITTGNVRKVHPPATELMAAAINDTPKKMIISGKVIGLTTIFIAECIITWQNSKSIYSSVRTLMKQTIAIASDHAGV